MNSIIYEYNTAIDEFKNSQKNSSEISIEEIISILSRIESILFVFDKRFRDIRYAKKYLKLLLYYRDIQYRIVKLESTAQPQLVADYLAYLKKQESEIFSQIQDFNSRKELEFPLVKKKNIVSVDLYGSKAAKNLRKIEEYIGKQANDIESDAENIYKVLNKFNKYVQAAPFLDIVEADKLAFLKPSLKILNDIIFLENLIITLYSFYKKNFEQVESLLDVLENEKMKFVDAFENVEVDFVENCRMIVKQLNNEK